MTTDRDDSVSLILSSISDGNRVCKFLIDTFDGFYDEITNKWNRYIKSILSNEDLSLRDNINKLTHQKIEELYNEMYVVIDHYLILTDKDDPAYEYLDELSNIISVLDTALHNFSYGQNYFENTNLLPPSESPAPVRVRIYNSRVTLTAPKHHTGTVPDPSIERLRQAIHDIFERALDALSQSTNVDPRLSKSCQGLIFELKPPLSEMSIEAVGLNWQITNDVLEITKETVPDPVLAQLQRVLTTVHTILAQYEEWQIYLAAEAGTKLTLSEIRVLADETVKLADELAIVPKTVEPKIVERLRNMTDAIALGVVQAEGLGVALIGSISNLLTALSQVALERLPSSLVDTALSRISSITETEALSGAIILSALSFKIINNFAPTFAQFAPLSWLIGVHAEIIKFGSYIKDFLKK